MKKFFKMGCLGIIGLVILGAIIGALSGGDDTATEPATETPATETPAADAPAEETPAEEPAAEEPAEEAAGVGTPLNVGDVTYTVNAVETADQVGPSVLPETASGKYVVVDVTFKNNGNEAVTVDSSFFKMLRGEKTYEADAVASMSANQGEDGSIENSFFLQEVNPDSEISGKVVFDVAPEVAEAQDLQLQVQTGLFGTETGVINLR